MADFTLFEVHLHDGFEFSPSNRAPLFSKRNSADEDDYDAELESTDEYEYDEEYEVEIEGDDESESGGRSAMGVLMGLVLLVGIAAGVRYIRGRGGDDELDDLADLDDREEVEIDA